MKNHFFRHPVKKCNFDNKSTRAMCEILLDQYMTFAQSYQWKLYKFIQSLP